MMSRSAIEFFVPLFDTTYRTLGESAPRLSNDVYTVRTYEVARAMGEVALALRAQLGGSMSVMDEALESVVRESVASDPSGALAMYCFSSLVGSRLLVSLRDAREFSELSEEEFALLSGASDVVLAEMVGAGEAAKSQGPIENDAWAERARALSQQLDDAGYAGSFGFSR
ncbi:MAG TPA: hypothetical protein VMF33_03300 [Acidimicrobiales bacterium]|nr:hypothetical protein [Acidimicrobiales bacterium]